MEDNRKRLREEMKSLLTEMMTPTVTTKAAYWHSGSVGRIDNVEFTVVEVLDGFLLVKGNPGYKMVRMSEATFVHQSQNSFRREGVSMKGRMLAFLIESSLNGKEITWDEFCAAADAYKRALIDLQTGFYNWLRLQIAEICMHVSKNEKGNMDVNPDVRVCPQWGMISPELDGKWGFVWF